MARRQKRAEHDNHERWLISYADFITLLFAFFVVMYSISSVNEGKYKTFSDSLGIAFDKQPPAVGSVTRLAEQKNKVLVDKRSAQFLEQQHKNEQQMKTVDNNLRQVMASMIAQGQVGITRNGRGVVIISVPVRCSGKVRRLCNLPHWRRCNRWRGC